MVLVKEHNPESTARLRQTFRRNRRIVRAVSAGGFLFVGLVIITLSEHWNLVVAASASYVLFTWIISYRLWRCPRCALLFGRRRRMPQCPSCGLELDGEQGAG